MAGTGGGELLVTVPTAGLHNDLVLDPVADQPDNDPAGMDTICISTPPLHLGPLASGHGVGALPSANYTVGVPQDVDQLVASYEGEALVQRLEFVADHAPGLRQHVLTLLAAYLKEKTHQVAAYERIMAKLISMQPSGNTEQSQSTAVNQRGPDVVCETGGGAGNAPTALDRGWMEQAGRQAAAKQDRLEQDLKHYRTNSIKESIRRGLDDLALHHLDTGNLGEALKAFTRARDYCTNHKHQIQMCVNVVRVCVHLRNWPIALGYVARAYNSLEVAAPAGGLPAANAAAPATARDAAYRASVLAKLTAVQGLADLAHCKYKLAAKAFLQAGVESLQWAEVLNAREAAVYGAVCALAKFDRAELASLLQQSAPFKQLVEAEPGLGAVVRHWAGSQYSLALCQLDQLAPDLRLDLFLGPHVDSLLAAARARGMAQYVEPYSAVRLDRMADAFNTTVDQLKVDLAALILDGQIRARIDSHRSLLVTRSEDVGASAKQRANAAATAAATTATVLALRAAFIKGKVCVSGSAEQRRGDQHEGGAAGGPAGGQAPKGIAATLRTAFSTATGGAQQGGAQPRAAAQPRPQPANDPPMDMQSAGSDIDDADDLDDSEQP